MFMIVPIVLAPFFSALDTSTLDPEWAIVYNETSTTIQFFDTPSSHDRNFHISLKSIDGSKR